MTHRMHIDSSVKLIGKLLFGIEKGPELLYAVRPAGLPLVDDWDCLKQLVLFSVFVLSCAVRTFFFYTHIQNAVS